MCSFYDHCIFSICENTLLAVEGEGIEGEVIEGEKLRRSEDEAVGRITHARRQVRQAILL